MKFECNIKRTGRIVRIAIGILLLLDSFLLWWYQLPSDRVFSRVLQLLPGAAGLFSVFEGVAGWCAIRAMGIRTKF
jgi:hypothetical protein